MVGEECAYFHAALLSLGPAWKGTSVRGIASKLWARLCGSFPVAP